MKLNVFLSGTIALLLTSQVFAQAPQEGFNGEAEAGAVIISGGTDSESYAGKAKTTYKHEKNLYTAQGRYLRTISNGDESARNWEAGLRYDHELTEYIGIFVGHKAESDVYNGYIQRDSSDLGMKQYLIRSDVQSWTVEAGYRYTLTHPTVGDDSRDSFGRLYTEYSQVINPTLSFKYWAEYLPNFTENDAWLGNTEASLNVMLSSVFSLKLAYLLQYQNLPAAGAEYTTTTSTMNLVAKF